jgi:hypothetical protein
MKKFCVFLFTLNAVFAVGQQRTMFEDYISNFRDVQADTVNRNDIIFGKQISDLWVRRYVMEKPDCECTKEGLWYRYASKIENDLFTIAFICKNCDIPSSIGSYPYQDMIMKVYSKNGKIIDSKIVSRAGDLWFYNYSGTWDPFILRVEQAAIPLNFWETHRNIPAPCEIETCIYTITEEGMIEKKLHSKEKGYIEWDIEHQKSRIVKGL